MRLYVETNFVLELALLQGESDACHGIVALAEAGRVELTIPAYSLVEPAETLFRRRRDRGLLLGQFETTLTEMLRSAPLLHEQAAFGRMVSTLRRSLDEDFERLPLVQGQIMARAVVLPMDRQVLEAASGFRTDFGLGQQDAIVLASIARDLGSRPGESACFVTTNSADFGKGGPTDLLASLSCKLLFRFSDALAYVQSSDSGA